LHLIDRKLPLAKIKLKKQRKKIVIAPEVLDRYVGEYELIPTFIMTVTKEKDHLAVQATDQPRLNLFAESETEFFLDAVDAQVTFVLAADGTTSELILHQNGANQRAKKRNP
jgi:serine-type D-Ala-D-Ala carboxypeptidase/endopeptidase